MASQQTHPEGWDNAQGASLQPSCPGGLVVKAQPPHSPHGRGRGWERGVPLTAAGRDTEGQPRSASPTH